MRYVWTCGALLALAGAWSEQEQSVLRITVTVSDGAQPPTPVSAYTLLVSDEPPTREPRRIRTSADGTVVITLPPGSYIVESDRPAALHGKGYQWTAFIKVAGGRENTLALSADNAEIVPLTESSSGARAETREAGSLLDRWQASVVAVWSPTARASGFLVDKRGLIATDRRAIGAATSVEVQVSPTTKVPARVLLPDARDVAIVWIDPGIMGTTPPVPLPCPPAPSPAIDDGDEIVAIAFPHRRDKELESGEVTALQARAVETDLRFSFGGAGGPVFDERGTLIGLSSLTPDDDVKRASEANVVRSVFICEALAASLATLAGATPPEPTRLPIEPTRAYPAPALDATTKGRAGAPAPAALSSSDFDVVLLTPPVVQAARERAGWTGGRSARSVETEARLGQLTEFAAWSDYFRDLPPVLIVRVTPKLVEGFWKRLGREAARTQGAVLPPFKDFNTSFGHLRLTCGASEVLPLHPFVLEHRVSEKSVVREGLYVFAPDALGPHCDSVTIALSTESARTRTETLSINRAAIDRIWEDFAPYRATSK